MGLKISRCTWQDSTPWYQREIIETTAWHAKALFSGKGCPPYLRRLLWHSRRWHLVRVEPEADPVNPWVITLPED